MPEFPSSGMPADITPLSTATDKLLHRQVPAAEDDAKAEKSAKDFESILLGSWLQQAEESFAKLPGGDDEEDQDPGNAQFQSIAMQSLGASIAAAGGIGIAKMIAAGLQSAQKETLDRI